MVDRLCCQSTRQYTAGREFKSFTIHFHEQAIVSLSCFYLRAFLKKIFMVIKLEKDVSNGKGGFYGKKNEKVILITAEHGEVLIVESNNGRFPVKIEDTDYKSKEINHDK